MDFDEVYGPNPVTFSMSSEFANFAIHKLNKEVYPGFIRDIVRAVNHYCSKNLVRVDNIPAQKFYHRIIDGIETVLEGYGINTDHFNFSEVEYFRILKRFGGRVSWELILHAVVAQDMSDMPQCYTCKHCKTYRDGYRECRKVFVPVAESEDENQKILRLNKDIPISNSIEDIRETFSFADSRCECYAPRTTRILDWILD